MIQFIVDRKEETDISEEAKEWFYDLVLNGDRGPFTIQRFNDQSKSITLSIDTDQQQGLFG